MMGSYTVLILFAFLVEGVFGDADEVKSVMEGDLVTLNASVIKQQQDMVRWYFNDIRIALINGDSSTSCLYDGEGGRFRGRLEVDYKTGSLIITDITTEHAGRYEAEIIRSKSSGKSEKFNIPSKCNSTKITPKSSNLGETIKSISLTVSGVSAAEQDEMKRMIVKEGESVTLDPGKTKTSVLMRWHFSDILMAEITGDESKICTDDECKERFRDRLKLNNQTGSLTITDTRTTDTGLYKLQISSNSRRHRRSFNNVKSFKITVTDSGRSSASPGIVIGVLLVVVAAAVAVIYYKHRSFHTWQGSPTDTI